MKILLPPNLPVLPVLFLSMVLELGANEKIKSLTPLVRTQLDAALRDPHRTVREHAGRAARHVNRKLNVTVKK